MPSGKVHAIATAIIASGSLPAMLLLSQEPANLSIAFTAGCAAGLILSPDLDIRHTTESQYLVRKTGGCVAGALWTGLWWPYAHLLIPRHRHPLSHLPILGTAIRVVYLAGVPLILWWLLHLAIPEIPLPTLPQISLPIWWSLGGLALVDALHTILDITWPFK